VIGLPQVYRDKGTKLMAGMLLSRQFRGICKSCGRRDQAALCFSPSMKFTPVMTSANSV
jgi:hypothetical protein